MLTKYWQSWQVCFIHSNWCVQCILPILRPEIKYVYINDYLSLSIYFCVYYAFENVDVCLLILACGLINILNLNLNSQPSRPSPTPKCFSNHI